MQPHNPNTKAPWRVAIRPAAPQLAIAVVTAVAGGLSTLVGTFCAVQFVAEVRTEPGLAAVLAWAIGAALLGLSAWAAHAGEARFSLALRSALAARLMRLPSSALARIGGDRLRRAVSTDIAALHHAVAHLPAELATLLIVPSVSIIVLLSIAGPSALLTLIPGALAAAYYLVIVPRVAARTGAEQAALLHNIESAVDDYAGGIRITRIFGAQTGASAEYRRATERFTHGIVSWVARVATPSAIATACMQAGVTYAVAYLVGYARSPEVLAALMLFGLAVVTPALRLGHGTDYLRAGRAAATRIQELFCEPALTPREPTLDRRSTAPHSHLSVSGLTVRIDGHDIISDLDQVFSAGEVTVVTGASGAGKSTLLRALAGWEHCSAAHVQLTDDRTATSPASEHPPLLIPQGTDVLDATVRENLVIDGFARADRELRAALASACIDVDLDARAASLSGGERQRVGLARVFLSNAPWVLLDEPTSALDRSTSTRVMEELRAFARDEHRIVVLVTHDPDIASAADARLDLATSPHASAHFAQESR